MEVAGYCVIKTAFLLSNACPPAAHPVSQTSLVSRAAVVRLVRRLDAGRV